MKKKIFIPIAIVFIISVIFVIYIKSSSSVEKNNLIELGNKIQALSNEEYDLKDITPFEWDFVYNFQPFYPIEDMAEAMGFNILNRIKLKTTINEGTQQLVFVKNNKLVCYVHGYSYKVGYRFNIGNDFRGYIQLKSSDQNIFNVSEKDGIIYLDYKNKQESVAASESVK